MKIALIFNSNSLDTVLCKHVVMALFSNVNDYTFIDTKITQQYYKPTETETITHDKFIFLGTYPTLDWFDEQRTKFIEVFATYLNQAYTFNPNSTKFLFATNTILSTFLRYYYSAIVSNTITNVPYNNRQFLFDKISMIFEDLITKNKNQVMMKLLGLTNDDAIANLVSQDTNILLQTFADNIIKTDYKNNFKMFEYSYLNSQTETNILKYITVFNQNPETQDSLIKAVNHFYLDTNKIFFIEYAKYLDSTTVELTYSPVDSYVYNEPVLNEVFGLLSSSNDREILNYIQNFYDIDLTNFMDNQNVNNSVNYFLRVNYNNTISIRVPVDVFLSVKETNDNSLVQQTYDTLKPR